MKRTTTHALCALALFLLTSPARAEVTIVANLGNHPSAHAAGNAEDQVNWLDADNRDDTICTESSAALELQRVLRKATGRDEDFVIVDDDTPTTGDLILIGGPDSNSATRRMATRLDVDPGQLGSFGPEGYRIKTTVSDGRRVTLVAGGGRVGTLYGAYDLLYRTGCRWFAPGASHESVPRISELPDVDVIQRPSFLTRGFHAWENRGDVDFLLWMARNRLNYWCVEQQDHPLMRKLGIQMSCGGHHAQGLFINPYSPYPYDHPAFDADDANPKDAYRVSQQYQGDADGDGRLSFFEAHPEWYALVSGKRVPGLRKSDPAFGTNYCTSNSEATAELMKNHVQALIDGPYTGADVVRFWTLDVGKWCQCDRCQALGTPTDRNLLLVHQFDRAVKKAQAEGRINRPIIIRFLAYADVLEPPTRPLPDDFDYQTCSATFFPIVRCYVHNFDDPGCEKNARYNRQLAGWAVDPDRHYRGQICIGEYYNVSGYRCLPVCFMHSMANDVPFYHRKGARHFHYMHTTTANWGSKTLTNYQMARQIWDVQTDCQALWTDYFARRYGSAADSMRSFHESLEQMLCNVSELKYGLARRLGRGQKDLFTSSHLRFQSTPGVKSDGPTLTEIVAHGRTCRQLVDRVLDVELPQPVRACVEEDERLFTYAERTVAYYDACVRAFQLARQGKIDQAKPFFGRAEEIAQLLRQDTLSTSKSYSPIIPNALVASEAEKALEHLAKLLEADEE